MTISDAGEILEGTEVRGKLSIINVEKVDDLQKIGNSLYAFKANAKPEVTAVPNATVQSGFIEMSNINVVQEMTDMIQTHRVFESTQKAISAYDSMADKLVNVVGKTGL